MKTFIIVAAALLSFQFAFAQAYDKYEAFNAADYPVGKFHVKLDTATFLTYKIEFRHIKPIEKIQDSTMALYCRAWVNITNKGKITKQLYFKNIRPLGGCSGLFIPEIQPRPDYFIFSKFGDYDGWIFALDAYGKFTENPGGTFYVSNDQHYLFSSYYSDAPGLTVYDLNKKRILYSFNLEYQNEEWYFQDNTYFTKVISDNKLYSKIKIAIYDLESNQMTTTMVDRNYPQSENKLKLYNDHSGARDCSCGK